MNLALWVANVVCAAAFAYATTWSGATLAFGRAISIANTKAGYQDAVTPPWVANLGLLTYTITAAIIIFSWYNFGAYRGCISILVVLAGAIAFRRILPKELDAHYKIRIIQSMASRYADYVRDNDKVRAAVMKELLANAGVLMDRGASVPTADT
jgi:hypothetical protein